MQFVAMNPNVEVNGQTVLAIAKGMGVMESMGLEILADNHIHDPKPDMWFPQQNWLNAFKQIAEKVGPHTLFFIGKSIPENADFPPAINTIEKALASIDIAYHMNHRLYGEVLFDSRTGQMREGIGHYSFRQASARSAEVICENPYPCDFDRGIIEAMAKRFKPADSFLVSVTHDHSKGCRKNGTESCTYTITW